jgi:transcriptional regulator of acetoin/glycerol metabolism
MRPSCGRFVSGWVSESTLGAEVLRATHRSAREPRVASMRDAGTALATGVGMLPPPLKIAREQAIREFEHAYLVALLAHVCGNVSAAARAAGVDRVYFYRLLWKHGLK